MNCIKELKNKYKMNYITYQNIFLSGLKFYNIDSPNIFIKSLNFIIKPTLLFSLLIKEVCLLEASFLLKSPIITYL
jgi:hypothetical protein